MISHEVKKILTIKKVLQKVEKLQAYQFLTQKKKKRSGRAMVENWNAVMDEGS